jgi:hypothetical protein
MGLDTSHDCWSGAYSAFNRWRNKVAEVAGYEIAKIPTEIGASDTVLIDWGHVTPRQLDGDWDETPADPLLVLIAHSDCDGRIRARDAGPLAERLAELLPLMPDEEAPGHVRHWRTATQRFINGLRDAHRAGEDVEFA